MNCFLKLSIFSLLLTLSNGKVPSIFSKKGKNAFSNLATLPIRDQVRLKIQSLLAPNSLPEGLLSELREVPEYWPIYSVDLLNVEARQLLLQSKKIGPEVSVPEYRYSYSNDYCFWWWCVKEDVTYNSGGTRFIGTDTITSESKITPNTFTNMFHVGSFNWTSPDYLLNVTDYLSAEMRYWKGSFLSLEGFSVGFQFNYGPVDGLGIQVSNLTLHFNPGKIRGDNYIYEVYDFDGALLSNSTGNPEQQGEDLERYLTETWFELKRDYSFGMQWAFNCLLSHGGSDEDCWINQDFDYQWEKFYYEFSRITLLQFIQSVVLGELVG